MPLKGLSPFAKGLRLRASTLTAMWDAIRAAQVTIQPGTGLNAVYTPNGTRINFQPVEVIEFAVITTECPAYGSAGTGVHGKGAGTVYTVAYSATGAASDQATGLVNIPIYNPGNGKIVVGSRVRLAKDRGQRFVVNQFC